MRRHDPTEAFARRHRCACGAFGAFGLGPAGGGRPDRAARIVWYCREHVPDRFWDAKRAAEGKAAAPPAPIEGPKPRQGDLL